MDMSNTFLRLASGPALRLAPDPGTRIDCPGPGVNQKNGRADQARPSPRERVKENNQKPSLKL